MFKVIFEINIIIFYCFKISNIINNTFIQIYQKESNCEIQHRCNCNDLKSIVREKASRHHQRHMIKVTFIYVSECQHAAEKSIIILHNKTLNNG